VRVSVDGTNVGTLQVAENEASSHKALIPILVPVTVAAGSHTVTYTAITGAPYYTGTDGYDIFDMTVLELPITAP